MWYDIAKPRSGKTVFAGVFRGGISILMIPIQFQYNISAVNAQQMTEADEWPDTRDTGID